MHYPPHQPPRAPRRRPHPAVAYGAVPVTLAMTALLVVSALLLARGHPEPRRSLQGPSTGGYDWTAAEPLRPNPRGFAVGVAHSQYSIDDWGDDDATHSARKVLTATATYQNQHIFGWGTLNPEPSAGVFDWSSLDRRMSLIRSTGGTPVITLCCYGRTESPRPAEVHRETVFVHPETGDWLS